MQYHHRTLGHFIDLLSEDYYSRVAVKVKTKYRTERYSYLQIRKLARQTAEHFLSQGIKKGDKIVVCSPNCIEYITLLIAAGISGIIIIPIDVNSNDSLVKVVYDETEPKLIIHSDSARSLIENANINVKDQSIRIEKLFSIIKEVDELDFLKRDYFISDNDIFEIVYTSGTTSTPKGVVLTHKNITGNLRSLRERMICKPVENFLCLLPLSHMFGQVLGLLYPFRFGSTVTVLEETNSILISQALVSENITFIVTVPEFLKLLHDRLIFRVEAAGKTESFNKLLKLASYTPVFVKRFLFRSLYEKFGKGVSTMFCGGASLPIDTELFWENVGVKVIQGYGLTEASPVVAASNPIDRIPGSVGKALPRQGVKIAEDGEVLTFGENLFSGYYKKDDLNETLFEEGWFKTGDIGVQDEEGNLFIKGRKKNMFLSSSGMNVYPEDIELELDKLEGVKTSVVLGNTSEEGKLTIVAVIIPDEDHKGDLNDLKDRLNLQLKPHQKVSGIHLWDEDDFPRTHTLKVIRREVQKRIDLIEADSIVDNNEHAHEVDFLLAAISKVSEISVSQINEDHHLQNDLGFDSIKMIELLVSLEEKLGKKLDEDVLSSDILVKDIRIEISKESIDGSEVKLKKWQFRYFTRMIRSAVFGLTRSIVFRKVKVQVEGAQNLENINSPVLIVSNHQSHVDTLVILSVLPKKIRNQIAVAAAHDYFYSGERKLMTFFYIMAFNIFGFYRNQSFRQNFVNIGKILDNKWNVLLYPEGSRSRDGNLQPFKQGVGMLVKTMRIPVLPIKVEGLYDLMPADSKKLNSGTVKVKIGKVQEFYRDDKIVHISDSLERYIKEL